MVNPLADLCLLENSYFPHLDRIALRRTQEECPGLHTFLAAAVETGHGPSCTMMRFNQTDLSRTRHILNTSIYRLQAPSTQPRAWLPAQGMWAWALCSGCAESWISSLAGWARVCQIHCSTLCSTGWNGTLLFIVTWIMKSSCKPCNIWLIFSVLLNYSSKWSKGYLERRHCQHWDLSQIQV